MSRPSKPVLTVRGLNEDEWHLLRQMRLAALSDSPAMFGSTLVRELGFDEGTWRARTGTTALAWEQDEPVGIVGWAWTDQLDRRADVVSMWVAPAARGRGIGAALVRWVIAETVTQRGAALELGVVADNIAALALYRRHGFVPVSSAMGAHSGRELVRMGFGGKS